MMAWVSNALTSALNTARSAQQQVYSAAGAFGSTAQLHDILSTAASWQVTIQQQGQKWWDNYSYKVRVIGKQRTFAAPAVASLPSCGFF